MSSSHDIVRILVRNILGGETDLGVTGGQTVADLVPGDHSEGVVGPGRHGDLEGGGGGWNKVCNREKTCYMV